MTRSSISVEGPNVLQESIHRAPPWYHKTNIPYMQKSASKVTELLFVEESDVCAQTISLCIQHHKVFVYIVIKFVRNGNITIVSAVRALSIGGCLSAHPLFLQHLLFAMPF